MWKAIGAGLVFALVFIIMLVFLQAAEVVATSLLPILEPVLTSLFAWIYENPIKIAAAAVVALVVTGKLFYLRQHRASRQASVAEHPPTLH